MTKSIKDDACINTKRDEFSIFRKFIHRKHDMNELDSIKATKQTTPAEMTPERRRMKARREEDLNSHT